MKTKTEPLIHIAGSFFPDTGQACIVCGRELVSEARGDPWTSHKTGWKESSLILTEGNQSYSVSDLEEHPEGVRMCSVWDADEDEEQEMFA